MVKLDSFKYNDGGRASTGFKGDTGDCVCRAISIATETPYKEVYDLINETAKGERLSKRKKRKSHARTGVHKATMKKVIDSLGWEWIPTMKIGSGCKVHLKGDELPEGRLVVRVSKHVTAVIDGVINDTYNPSRDGSRCVYGYFQKKECLQVRNLFGDILKETKMTKDYVENVSSSDIVEVDNELYQIDSVVIYEHKGRDKYRLKVQKIESIPKLVLKMN